MIGLLRPKHVIELERVGLRLRQRPARCKQDADAPHKATPSSGKISWLPPCGSERRRRFLTPLRKSALVGASAAKISDMSYAASFAAHRPARAASATLPARGQHEHHEDHAPEVADRDRGRGIAHTHHRRPAAARRSAVGKHARGRSRYLQDAGARSAAAVEARSGWWTCCRSAAPTCSAWRRIRSR